MDGSSPYHPTGATSADDPIGPALLDVAEASLRAALGQPVAPPDPATMPGAVHEVHDAFVTLHVDGKLNGCIGALGEGEPLVAAVARLTRQAAFDDPRLPPLHRDQLGATEIEVSVLSPLEPVPATSREALLAALEPRTHGLVVARGRRRGVFLPTVWAQIPEPQQFLDHLLAKAGLRPGTWPHGLRAWRFTTRRWDRRLAP